MERNKGKLLSGLLALGVWQLAAVLLDNELLLAGPVQVAGRLLELMVTREFWQAVGFTFSRITLGFLLAFCLALLLAALGARFPLARVLIQPYMAAVKAVPVASFIVIALLWLSGRRLSVFISFLMVLPVLYANFLQGLREADEKLLEMARVFRMSLWNRVRASIFPPWSPTASPAAGPPWGCAGRREWLPRSSGSAGAA